MTSPTNYIRDGPATKEKPARISAAPVPRLAQESLSATPHEIAPRNIAGGLYRRTFIGALESYMSKTPPSRATIARQRRLNIDEFPSLLESLIAHHKQVQASLEKVMLGEEILTPEHWCVFNAKAIELGDLNSRITRILNWQSGPSLGGVK